MNIQQLHMAEIPTTYGIGVRHFHPDYPKQVEIGKHHVPAGFYFQWLALRTLLAFFLQLKRIYVPVRYLIKPHFIPDMVFDRQGVNSSAGGCMVRIKSRTRIGAGGPYIFKDPASIICYP